MQKKSQRETILRFLRLNYILLILDIKTEKLLHLKLGSKVQVG